MRKKKYMTNNYLAVCTVRDKMSTNEYAIKHYGYKIYWSVSKKIIIIYSKR